MARTPDEGQAREVTIQARVTEALKMRIDKARGGVKMSPWLRQAAEEKLEREK